MPNGERNLELDEAKPERATQRAMCGSIFEDFYVAFAQVPLDDEAFEGRPTLHRPPLGTCCLGLSGDECISEAKLTGTCMSMKRGVNSTALVGIVKEMLKRGSLDSRFAAHDHRCLPTGAIQPSEIFGAGSTYQL